MSTTDETTKDDLGPDFEIREPQEQTALKLEIEQLQALVSFGNSPVGKQLVAERERQIPILINKLFAQLKDPNLTQIISVIAQLKVAMRDLVDFKGAQNSLEEKTTILDSLIRKKSE